MFVQTWDSRGRDLVEGGWFNISFIRFVVFSLNLVERDCKLHLCFLPLVQWWRILIWCQKYRLIATLKMWNKLWRSYSTHSTRAALYESFNKTWLCITVKYSSIWCDGTNTDDWFVPLGWRQTSVLFVSSSAVRQPPDLSDLFLPAPSASVLQPGRHGGAAALRHQQLPLHRHGQLHALQKRGQRRGLRHGLLKRAVLTHTHTPINY